MKTLAEAIILCARGCGVSRSTYDMIHAAATDAGNRAMRKADRRAWSPDDYDAAVVEFDRLVSCLCEHNGND